MVSVIDSCAVKHKLTRVNKRINAQSEDKKPNFLKGWIDINNLLNETMTYATVKEHKSFGRITPKLKPKLSPENFGLFKRGEYNERTIYEKIYSNLRGWDDLKTPIHFIAMNITLSTH